MSNTNQLMKKAKITTGIHWATGKAWAEVKVRGFQLVTQWGETEAEATEKALQYIARHK